MGLNLIHLAIEPEKMRTRLSRVFGGCAVQLSSFIYCLRTGTRFALAKGEDRRRKGRFAGVDASEISNG